MLISGLNKHMRPRIGDIHKPHGKLMGKGVKNWIENRGAHCLWGGGWQLHCSVLPCMYVSVLPRNSKFSSFFKEIENKVVLILTQFHEKRVHLALFLAAINVHAITRYILINLKFHLITFQGCVYYTDMQISKNMWGWNRILN